MKPLVIIYGAEGIRIGFKEQWDMEKQPYFCLFRTYMKKDNYGIYNRRTERIFTLGGKV